MAESTVPVVIDPGADQRFRLLAKAMALNPDDRWVGGYVDYEWRHARRVFELLPGGVDGRNVLEFGCNYGATSIVLARLGATVSAIDVDASYVRLAKANAERFGLCDAIRFEHVEDTRKLPFADAAFDVISCNSVLEYVPHRILPAVQRELDRVLKPGGSLVIVGTSSRLWPREVHSRRWLVNYIPRWVDHLIGGGDLQRGVSPWALCYGFGHHYVNADVHDRGGAYVEARRRMGAAAGRVRLLRAGSAVAARFGLSLGLLTPSISVILRKSESARSCG